MELFDTDVVKKDLKKPLADRMRPQRLEEFIGQEHLLGAGKLLRVLLEKKDAPSMVFWGPPGVGKTSLGWLIGKHLDLPFVSLSAVVVGIREVKDIIQKAKHRKIILFVDEFHRFNKLQQDTFLPHVENGNIILIGATTENPSFEIISPLLSRMRVLTLNSLSEDEVLKILKRALAEDPELTRPELKIEDGVLEELARLSSGDARTALNLLEVGYKMAAQKNRMSPTMDGETLREAYQKKILTYDKKGEMHYDVISALHKSLRGSDPDASLYWLARMIEAGEDPLFIARRLVRFASEDVGNADPQALQLTIAAMQAFNFIGPPEGYLALAQACVYLALSEKSNAIYTAYSEAASDIRSLPEYAVPLHIRNAPTPLMKDLDYSKGYLYPHNFDEAMVKQDYMPEALKGRRYYRPTDRGYEKKLKDFLEKARKIHEKDLT
jgi:putative ATPase